MGWITKVMEPWVSRLDLLGLSTGLFSLCPDSRVAWNLWLFGMCTTCSSFLCGVCMQGLQKSGLMLLFFLYYCDCVTPLALVADENTYGIAFCLDCLGWLFQFDCDVSTRACVTCTHAPACGSMSSVVFVPLFYLTYVIGSSSFLYVG